MEDYSPRPVTIREFIANRRQGISWTTIDNIKILLRRVANSDYSDPVKWPLVRGEEENIREADAEIWAIYTEVMKEITVELRKVLLRNCDPSRISPRQLRK